MIGAGLWKQHFCRKVVGSRFDETHRLRRVVGWRATLNAAVRPSARRRAASRAALGRGGVGMRGCARLEGGKRRLRRGHHGRPRGDILARHLAAAGRSVVRSPCRLAPSATARAALGVGRPGTGSYGELRGGGRDDLLKLWRLPSIEPLDHLAHLDPQPGERRSCRGGVGLALLIQYLEQLLELCHLGAPDGRGARCHAERLLHRRLTTRRTVRLGLRGRQYLEGPSQRFPVGAPAI
eukprot:scaffold1107_cov90-Isochrysis_galbana.AAC.2